MERTLRRSLAKQKREEQKLFKELKSSYRSVEEELLAEANKVFDDISKNPNTQYEHERITTLLNQTRRELQKYAIDYVVPHVAQGMVQSSYLGSEQARDVLRNVVPQSLMVTTLPSPTIDAFTRHLTTGPLGELFNSFGDVAAAKARRDVLRSIALGHNPRKTARYLKRSLGISRSRALLIARTETMRAHREGSRQYYQSNSHLVEAWVWHASPSSRTCAACWALHGREFPLNERMAAHPACRCSMVPKPKTWKQMGYNIEGDSVVEDGPTMFEKQPESTKKKVLGSQYDRYTKGEVTLDDFVATKQSKYGKTFVRQTPK